MCTVFQAEPASIPAARAWIADHLQRLAVDLQMLADVQLLLSELATNAVIHTASPSFHVHLTFADGVLEVSVIDGDPVRGPQVCSPSPQDEHGRGLRIVNALTDAWGTRQASTGKAVWFRVDPTSSPR